MAKKGDIFLIIIILIIIIVLAWVIANLDFLFPTPAAKTIIEAVQVAKEFITAAIKNGFKLNEYVGPTMHGAYRNQKESVNGIK